MYRAVDAVLMQHKEVVNVSDILAETVGRFRTSIDCILQRDKEYRGIIEDMDATRNSVVGDLIERALQCANALYAFGRRYGNDLLTTECRITQIDLNHCSDNELELRCMRLNDLAQEYATEIAVFEFDRPAFQSAIEKFGRQSGLRRYEEIRKKTACEMLYKAFEATDEILNDELDAINELIKSKHIDFYRQYQCARVTRDLGGYTAKNSRLEQTDPLKRIWVTEPVTI